MPVLKHTHKYIAAILGGEKIIRENGKKRLIKTGGFPIFRCASSDCSHFIQRTMALGKHTICWKCNEVMTMKPYNLFQKKPKHRDCTIESAAIIDKILDQKFNFAGDEE
jgi:hypothetical protein